MGPIIFVFHNVVEDAKEENQYGTRICISRFIKYIDSINKLYKIISIEDLVDKWIMGQCVKKYASISFDDCYANSIIYGSDIMIKKGIPAVYFIISGYSLCNNPDPFFFDIIEIALEITIAKNRNVEYYSILKNWKETHKRKCPSEADQFINNTLKKLKLNYNDINEHIKKNSKYQPASIQMIRRIVKKGFTIGSHSVTHHSMCSLSDNELNWELTHSKISLEKYLKTKIKYFAFPFGSSKDVSIYHSKFINEAGYDIGFTTSFTPGKNINNMLSRIEVD